MIRPNRNQSNPDFSIRPGASDYGGLLVFCEVGADEIARVGPGRI